jgi:hypothetical protein
VKARRESKKKKDKKFEKFKEIGHFAIKLIENF